MVIIIDYGAGNLKSVVNAIKYLGYEPKITKTPEDVLKAHTIILPGVGAAADTMEGLNQKGLIQPIRSVIAEGRPFLGVCIGLQVLFTGSEEGGWSECLTAIPGRVRRFPAGLKVPHIGWNQVHQMVKHPIFESIPDNANFYFVHSYFAEPEDKSIIAGATEYGITFGSVIIRDNLIATQFHPEKSGEDGLQIYANFLKFAGEKPTGRRKLP